MVNYLKLYLTTLAAFFAIDMLWLGLVARSFYRKHLGYLLASPPNWPAAMIFYLLFIVGIVVFVLMPGLKTGSLAFTLRSAVLFGLITYATYDLTNLATIRDWPVLVTLVDLMWGIILSVLVSLVGFGVARWLGWRF